MKKNEIRIERIPVSDPHVVEEGILNLETLHFSNIQMIYVKDPINLKCKKCNRKICECPKAVKI